MSDYKVSRISFEMNNMPSIEYPNENYNFINGNYEPIVKRLG
jgi:hypothetical protein